MTDQDYQPDSLTLWLAIEILHRQDKERFLKSFGLTWDKFKEIEQEAIMHVPPEGISFGGYHITVSETPIREYKLSESKQTGSKKYITIHSKQFIQRGRHGKESFNTTTNRNT